MTSQKRGFIKTFEELITDTDSSTKHLKILIVGTEAAPYASAGGFASVLGYLTRALADLGHDVRLFIPKYGHIDEDKYKIQLIHKGLRVPTDDEENKYLICNVKEAGKPVGVPIYFLENQEYYEKRANIYGYSDDSTRWALLSRGVLEFIRTEKWVPDLLHSNDWHTGLVSNYLETTYHKDPILSEVSTLFTIHNINFQGQFDHKNVQELDLDDGRSAVATFFSNRLNNQNFMRRGILYSDVVNTVSKTYAKEVLTSEYGEGLDKLLLEVKGKFFGIVNGLDYDEFNPKTDKLIEKNYDINSIDLRVVNKKALQKEFDLPINPEIPVMGYVGRLDHQKGLDLLLDTLSHVLTEYETQFVMVGSGDSSLTQRFHDLKCAFPKQVGVHSYFNATLPRLIYAGSDITFNPSRFEPCGLTQLEAMRYGAIPIVRSVGGLADTVENFDSVAQSGTGFVFKDFNEFALYGQIARALELYCHKKAWKQLQKNAMKEDYSWKTSAKEYVRLYELAASFNTKYSKDNVSA